MSVRNSTISRRRILKQMAAGGAAATGIGAATGSASAQSGDDSTPESSDVEPQGWQGVKTGCVETFEDRDLARIHVNCAGAWNVHSNADNYADYALDTALDHCRSHADVTAEIEAHVFDVTDADINLTCGGWGID